MFFPFLSDSDDSDNDSELDSDLEEVFHAYGGMKRAREEEKSAMDPSKKKKYAETFSQSQSYPFITFKLVESYTDDDTLQKGIDLESLQLCTILQITDDRFHATCYDNSKTKHNLVEFSTEEGSLKKITCDCPSEDVLKWCPHKTCAIIHLIHHPEQVIQYKEIKKRVCEEFSKKELETLVLNKCFEDAKFLHFIKDTKIEQLEEDAVVEKKLVIKTDQDIDTSIYIKELEDIEHQGMIRMFSPIVRNEKINNSVQNTLSIIHTMWQQKSFKNALLLLSKITGFVTSYDQDAKLVLTTSKIWLKYVTDEEVPKDLLKDFRDSLLIWSTKYPSPSMKFKAAYNLSVSQWNEGYLEAILSGEMDVVTPEDSSTLLARATILKSKMKEYNHITNYVFLREGKGTYMELLREYTSELESLSPSLAGFLYIRMLELGDPNLNGFKFIMNLNENTREERNSGEVQNLTVLSCNETAKELIKIRDWPRILRIFINFPEEIQNLLSLYMIAYVGYEFTQNLTEIANRIYNLKDYDLLYHFFLNSNIRHIEEASVIELSKYCIKKGGSSVELLTQRLLEMQFRSLLLIKVAEVFAFSGYRKQGVRLYSKYVSSAESVPTFILTDFYDHCEKIGEKETSEVIEPFIDKFEIINIYHLEKFFVSRSVPYYLDTRIKLVKSCLNNYSKDYTILNETKKHILRDEFPDFLFTLYKKIYDIKQVLEELLKDIQISNTLISYSRIAQEKNLKELMLKYIKKAINTKCGDINKTNVLNDFKNDLDQKDLLEIADAVMNDEPTIETFKILVEIDPLYKNKIDQYVKSDNITERTIPLIIESKKYEKIFDGYDRSLSQVNFITTLLSECIKAKLDSTFILNKFRLIIKNSILNGYDVIQFKFNHSGLDQLMLSILEDKDYGKDLGLFLIQSKTETLGRFVSSSSVSTYKLFVGWLSIIQPYFQKYQMEPLFKDFLNDICTWKQIKSKTKLVKMIKDQFP